MLLLTVALNFSHISIFYMSINYFWSKLSPQFYKMLIRFVFAEGTVIFNNSKTDELTNTNIFMSIVFMVDSYKVKRKVMKENKCRNRHYVSGAYCKDLT